MNKEHLENIVALSKEIKVDSMSLISEYTMLAIKNSVDGYRPKVEDYAYARWALLEIYKNET